MAGLPLRVQFPNGLWFGAGGASDPQLVVRRPQAFFARLGIDAKIGFGEAYMAGDWETGPGTDLADLLTPLRQQRGDAGPAFVAAIQAARGAAPTRQRIGHASCRRNRTSTATTTCPTTCSPRSSTRHSPTPRRCSTTAMISPPRNTARSMPCWTSQQWGRIVRCSRSGPDGASSPSRRPRRGAHVTTVTLSTEQRDLARRRVAEAGVDDRVRIILADYREVTGQYDAIVSVEMIEAVGLRYFPGYFATLDRLLRPGGRVGLQSITMAHDRLLATRDSYTWIHKYIFPGGIVPSVEAIEATLRTHTSLAIVDRRDFGPDYATTLQCWRNRFLTNWRTIAGHRFDDIFRRMWEFYLAYCEAGFRAGYLGVSQFALERT